MKAPRRRLTTAVLGVLVSLGCAGFLLKRANLAETWATLRHTDLWLLWPSLLIVVSNYPLRAWRWQLLFPGDARPRWGACFRALAIGNAANNFIPLRGGDVARCVLIARDTEISGATLALTWGLEKLLDGLALLGVVLLACAFLAAPIRSGAPASGRPWGLVLAGAVFFGVVVAMLAILRYRSGALLAKIEAAFAAVSLNRLGQRVAALFFSFAEGLKAIHSTARMSSLAIITGLIWLSEAGLVWAIAMPNHLSLSFPNAIVVAAVLGLGLMIPAAPSALGSYELLVVAALALAGINDKNHALAFAALLHAFAFVTTSLAGMACLFWPGGKKEVVKPAFS
jgi:hypothetical protein